jgi:hypothetical protein
MSKYHYYMLLASFFSFQLFINAADFEWDDCFDKSQAEEFPEADWSWEFSMDEDNFAGVFSGNSEPLEIAVPAVSNNCASNEEVIVLAPNNHTALPLKRPRSWHVAENKIFYLDGPDQRYICCPAQEFSPSFARDVLLADVRTKRLLFDRANQWFICSPVLGYLPAPHRGIVLADEGRTVLFVDSLPKTMPAPPQVVWVQDRELKRKHIEKKDPVQTKKQRINKPPTSLENKRVVNGKFFAPVMYAFLMCIQNKKGGFFKNKDAGIFTILDYYQLLYEMTYLCAKPNPTFDPESRKKTLTSRWLMNFETPALRHRPFDLTIKKDMIERYREFFQ